MSERLAAIRIRGTRTGVKKQIADTLNNLRLLIKNGCVVVPKNDYYIGMMKKAKDYITYGEISEEVFKELVEKRGKEFKQREQDKKGKIKYKFLEFEEKKYKPFFRLNNPKGGFERKGIKKSFSIGGVLGYRADKINDLLKRML